MSEFDEALSELRRLAQAEGCRSIEVHVEADGRVTIRGVNHPGFFMFKIEADLEPGGALPMPNQALHGVAFAHGNWCGK